MAHEKRQLCPFKKQTIREMDRRTGKATMRERFEPCAEKHCMAYLNGRCQMLEATNGK